MTAWPSGEGAVCAGAAALTVIKLAVLSATASVFSFWEKLHDSKMDTNIMLGLYVCLVVLP
jgi:hypothetical protein